MKNTFWIKKVYQRMQIVLIIMSFSLLLVSCASVDPANIEVELKTAPPTVQTTNYTQALADLGLMTEIYNVDVVKIQSNPIGDNTGTSGSTGGEIPRDITEMIKSALNSIGGRVTFIPYDPSFMQNQMVTGYSNFDDKLIPDVIISGGITEFDRGLETRGDGTDVSAGAEFTGLPDYLPSKEIKLRYGDTGKTGLASITLDFNLLNFKTMAGIPRMSAVNSMKVSKAMGEKELGISLFGQSFGRKGSVKKVQGRHAAVRLLVELSMIQVVGKYNGLPYWRLLGDDAMPDKDVESAIRKFYFKLGDFERIFKAQEWLYLHGYELALNGQIDNATILALKQFDAGYNPASKIDDTLFVRLYCSIPIKESTLGRRNQLDRIMGQTPAVAETSAPAVQQQPQAKQAVATQTVPAAAAQTAHAAPAAVKQQQAAPAPKAAAASSAKKKSSIGKILTDEEW
ncbi:MAG: hypothetical protein EHM85_05915 [Desulfobacteraceae bacterium]|nr:MAG: hypothetical protein EHM85_05915 [Desulfobacteraceae bacterium]